MRALIKYSTAVFSIIFLFLFSPKDSIAQGPTISFQAFYDDLSPYGDWVNYPGYGFVWVPAAGPEFAPYVTGGYWAYTQFGWTWISHYHWGWAPFHYGRWQYDLYYGWLWIPGDVWGPAWVIWRRCPGYYGWAPLGPGVSVNIVIGGTYQAPVDHWVFVDEHYIGREDIHNYYGPRKNNTTYISNSTVINNTYVDKSRNTTYIAGPDKNEVQKVRGKNIEPVSIKESTSPEQEIKDNQLRIFRPVVTKNDGKPSRVAEKNEVKAPAERKVLIQPLQTDRPAEKKTTEENKQPVQDDQNRKLNKTDDVLPVVPDKTKTQTPKPEEKIIREKPRTIVQPEKQQESKEKKIQERPKPVKQPVQQEKDIKPIPQQQKEPKVQPSEKTIQRVPQPEPQQKAEPRKTPAPQAVPQNQQPKPAPKQPRQGPRK